MVLLGNYVKWKLVFVHLETVLASVCAERTTGLEIILVAPMVLLRDMGQVETQFDPFGVVLFLTKDRCMVSVKCTIGSEIIVDAPNCTPRWRRSSRSSFSICLEIVLILAQERCTVCAECTMGMDISLSTIDGTPM
jgi:hypothetical protein